MNKLNLNYESDDPNESCQYPRCRNCYHEDNSNSHICDECILYYKNPKSVFRQLCVMSPYEILINSQISAEDVALVSSNFIMKFLDIANKERDSFRCKFENNLINILEVVRNEEDRT